MCNGLRALYPGVFCIEYPPSHTPKLKLIPAWREDFGLSSCYIERLTVFCNGDVPRAVGMIVLEGSGGLHRTVQFPIGHCAAPHERLILCDVDRTDFIESSKGFDVDHATVAVQIKGIADDLHTAA